jgi:hypothetical protein
MQEAVEEGRKRMKLLVPAFKRKLSAFVLLLLFGSCSFGADKDGNLWTVGLLTCGQWHEAAHSRVQRAIYAGWVYGYVTAVNNYVTPDMGLHISGDQARAYIDHYCDQNPLHDLVRAAAALVDEAGGPKAQHKWRK